MGSAMSAVIIQSAAASKPDLPRAFACIDSCHGDAGLLWATAVASMAAVDMLRKNNIATARRNRQITTALAVSFFAIGDLLGLTRDEILADCNLPPDGAA